jgi:hypothetical protein
MPATQAFTVDWTVVVGGENVDSDVVEVVVTQREDRPDSATVQLDTSKRPHAIEEEATLQVQLDDGNDLIEFRGQTDSVRDAKNDPLVTVDAREPEGELDDVTAAGQIRENNLWDVLDAIMDGSAGKIRGTEFNPTALKNNYGTFGGSVVFGDLTAYSIPVGLAGTGSSQDATWTQQETTGGQGKSAELQIDYYTNTTGTRYQAELQGEDGDNNDVTLTFDLPPGDDAQDAYGTDTFKLPISGGNGLVSEITGIKTNLPSAANTVNIGATVKNYVKTEYDFRIDSDQSVRDAVELIVGYISTLDDGSDWEYYVTSPITGTPELVIQPSSTGTPDRYVFTEGDNVLRPVANRSLDGVYNFVKVSGQGNVNVWAWAYDGTFYYSFNNPFESGEYPDNLDFNTTYGSTGRINDIDQIDLRGRAIGAPNADDVFQAGTLAEKALKQLYRTPVSGVAKTSGLHPADPGDEAEVYYPSRGIPAKVVDNVYTVKAVEYSVSSEEATTKVDFGITEPKTGDLLGAGGPGGAVRDDLSSSLQQNLQGGQQQQSQEGFPLVGTLQSQNDDGTWVVTGRDGNTYDGVEII